MTEQNDLFAAFSGGRSSAVMVAEMIRRGNPPAAVIFCNTGMETLETLDFAWSVAEHICKPAGVPFHAIEFCVKDGRRTWREVTRRQADRQGDVFITYIREKQAMPNLKTRNCTENLKVLLNARFIRDRYAVRLPTMAVGIRADEQRRIARQRVRNNKIEATINDGKLPAMGNNPTLFPLDDYGFTKNDVNAEIAKWGAWADFAKGGGQLSNCLGCFMNPSIRAYVQMGKDRPELLDAWIKAEEIVSTGEKKPDTERFTFPAALQETHQKLFNEPLPPELHKRWTSRNGISFVQIKMLIQRGAKLGSLPFPDAPQGDHGCGAYCGTD